jgi:hypothetical protein
LAEVLTTTSQAFTNLESRISSSEDKLKALQDQIASLSAQVAGIQTATSSATVATQSAQIATASATPVASESATLALTPPDVLLASGSATLANLYVGSEATVSGQLTAYSASIQDSFKSLGKTFLGTTTIAGDFSVDGTLSITGNSITALGTLSLQNGFVTIDSSGNVTAKTITVDKLILGAKAGNASIGTGTIAGGTVSASIATTALTDKSKVFVSLQSPTSGQSVYVSSQTTGTGFSVTLDHAVPADVTFNWMIVDEGN